MLWILRLVGLERRRVLKYFEKNNLFKTWKRRRRVEKFTVKIKGTLRLN